mmetsp:Transcript_2231/g.7953  ORF Transcript_2231/g.7953 Transcript_2231/m.7953 type:complete len:263 (-) Transcript_2231:907-1695(-)
MGTGLLYLSSGIFAFLFMQLLQNARPHFLQLCLAFFFSFFSHLMFMQVELFMAMGRRSLPSFFWVTMSCFASSWNSSGCKTPLFTSSSRAGRFWRKVLIRLPTVILLFFSDGVADGVAAAGGGVLGVSPTGGGGKAPPSPPPFSPNAGGGGKALPADAEAGAALEMAPGRTIDMGRAGLPWSLPTPPAVMPLARLGISPVIGRAASGASRLLPGVLRRVTLLGSKRICPVLCASARFAVSLTTTPAPPAPDGPLSGSGTVCA